MLRPIQHLPVKHPSEFDPGPEFFYENIAKPLIPDMIQMMNQGLCIDQKAVEKLRVVIDDVLRGVEETLAGNSAIKAYQEWRRPRAQKKHAEVATQAVRTEDYYLTTYKPGDMVHRTWVVNTYLDRIGKGDDKKDKWSVKDLKTYNIFLVDPLVDALIDKRPLSSNKHVVEGMRALARYKTELWNRPRHEKAKEPVKLDGFNPGSNKQLREFFELHKIAPVDFSKDTGEPSWNRKAIEKVKYDVENPDILEAIDAFIDHSFGGIIRANFLAAFDKFTVDGVLHGNVKLFGAKSFRLTSNSPNLLNAPSTGSIYAKPLKKCFVAPPGYIIYTADLSALEDRVIANLSGDKNKCDIFLEGLDGHSLNACGYFASELEEYLGKNTNNVEYVKAFMAAVEAKHVQIVVFRQNGKAPTFKLAYGGFPDAHKGGVITQEIFDNYHNVLYPGITDYRENYVLPTAKRQGYIHLGLGCRLHSNDAGSDIRTLNNGTVQFWSILTLLAINEFNHRIREAGMEDKVQVISTIYDSIYTQVVQEAEAIKWVNDNLIELMTVQYLEDEIIHNEAEGEISDSWTDMLRIPNGASVEQIQAVLDKVLERNNNRT